MFKKGNKADSTSTNPVKKKVHKISYDEHFTRATESIDLRKNPKFADVGDGISKREVSDIEKLSQ